MFNHTPFGGFPRYCIYLTRDNSSLVGALLPCLLQCAAMVHCVNTYDSKNVNTCNSHSLIVPVWLYHKDNHDKKELVYALLDNQSEACFIRDDVVN